MGSCKPAIVDRNTFPPSQPPDRWRLRRREYVSIAGLQTAVPPSRLPSAPAVVQRHDGDLTEIGGRRSINAEGRRCDYAAEPAPFQGNFAEEGLFADEIFEMGADAQQISDRRGYTHMNTHAYTNTHTSVRVYTNTHSHAHTQTRTLSLVLSLAIFLSRILSR